MLQMNLSNLMSSYSYCDNELRVKKTTSTRKRTNNSTSNESQIPSAAENNHPENQHLHRKKSSASKAIFPKQKKQIIIFGYNIPRDIRLCEFNC